MTVPEAPVVLARRLRLRVSADVAIACAAGVIAELDGVGVVRAGQVLVELARYVDEPVATVAAHVVAMADPAGVRVGPQDTLTTLLRRRWPGLPPR